MASKRLDVLEMLSACIAPGQTFSNPKIMCKMLVCVVTVLAIFYNAGYQPRWVDSRIGPFRLGVGGIADRDKQREGQRCTYH